MPEGSVHVLLGEPMNAFELFAYHFAAGGTKEQQVRYLATEQTADEVAAGVARVGGKADKVQAVTLPHRGKMVLPDLKDGFRYVIDDITTVAGDLGFEATLERLQTLREQARKLGTELLVTCTSGLLEPSQEIRLKLWADGVLELGFDRQGFGLYPFLKVTKMRGVPESSRFILFKETNAGLFMESTRRVF